MDQLWKLLELCRIHLNMKVAVTSVSGQLGGAIASQLVKEIGNENVVGVARTPDKLKHSKFEIRQGDYTVRSTYEAALRGIDALLLVSGNDDPEKRKQQHTNVIEAALKAGVRKVVYTSVIGPSESSTFSPIVLSNRHTENVLMNCGLDYVIGRNGIYIEPDVAYIDTYKKEGKISNCAGNSKCAYVAVSELAVAYSRMLVEEKHHGQVYNLTGEAITQHQLAEYLNLAFGTNLQYQPVSKEEYEIERTKALGDFLGKIIAGIYTGIHDGAYDISSDFEKAAGRKHIDWLTYFTNIKDSDS